MARKGPRYRGKSTRYVRSGQKSEISRDRKDGMSCRRCGTTYEQASCPATGRRCHKCKSINHFAKMCRNPRQHRKEVNAVEDHDSNMEHLFIGAMTGGDQDWIQAIDFGNIEEVFKLDTGAHCNVLPKTLYDKITAKPLQPSSPRLQSYTKTCIKPVVKCKLFYWVRGKEHHTCFQVVDGNYTPLLGRVSCEQMGLVQRINTVRSDSILYEFPEAFQGLGCLPKEYHISIDPSVPPVVHPPRRVPHSKREPLRRELNRTEDIGIIEKVPLNEPADWVSSLVCFRQTRSIPSCVFGPKGPKSRY